MLKRRICPAGSRRTFLAIGNRRLRRPVDPYRNWSADDAPQKGKEAPSRPHEGCAAQRTPSAGRPGTPEPAADGEELAKPIEGAVGDALKNRDLG